jgi:hypothetical protein
MNLLHHFPHPTIEVLHDKYDAIGRIAIFRGDKRYQTFKSGPNVVHAFITHPDGSIEDLGESHNLLTGFGADYWLDSLGGVSAATAQNGPATVTTATAVTGTGSTWTATSLSTDVAGLAGKVIMMPVTGLTTTPVYGLIGSSSTTVATIDKWWTPDFAGTGTTPASTSAFVILPGRAAPVLFMGLTTDSGAANEADYTLATEITTNGCARAKSTYTHAQDTLSATFVNAYSPLGTFTAIHKMGLFTCSNSTAAGLMVYEAVLNVDATVANGDTLTVTDTITVSG